MVLCCNKSVLSHNKSSSALSSLSKRSLNVLNLANNLKADVIEINISTKDTKIFMHKKNEKINIKSLQ